MGTLLRNRRDHASIAEAGRDAGRPVVLGTLACRIGPAAERMAIESALEVGSPLLVTNVVRLPNYPSTLMLVGPGAATRRTRRRSRRSGRPPSARRRWGSAPSTCA
jgi:hypothetical protein